MGRGGQQMGIPEAGWGGERRSTSIPGGFSWPLPLSKPPPAPRRWGVTTEAVSFSSRPAASPAALRGSVDPELSPGLAFATSHLCDLEHLT